MKLSDNVMLLYRSMEALNKIAQDFNKAGEHVFANQVNIVGMAINREFDKRIDGYAHRFPNRVEFVVDDPLALGPCNDCGLYAATKMAGDLPVCDKCHQEWCESFEPGDAHYHPRS